LPRKTQAGRRAGARMNRRSTAPWRVLPACPARHPSCPGGQAGHALWGGYGLRPAVCLWACGIKTGGCGDFAGKKARTTAQILRLRDQNRRLRRLFGKIHPQAGGQAGDPPLQSGCGDSAAKNAAKSATCQDDENRAWFKGHVTPWTYQRAAPDLERVRGYLRSGATRTRAAGPACA